GWRTLFPRMHHACPWRPNVSVTAGVARPRGIASTSHRGILMNLNISYSSNTLTNAPAAFFSAVNYVVNAFDSLFTNAVTVNVQIGYGTFPLDNSIVPALGESEQNHVTAIGYSQVVQHLLNEGA